MKPAISFMSIQIYLFNLHCVQDGFLWYLLGSCISFWVVVFLEIDINITQPGVT